MSGTCFNCTANTVGDQCERCLDGYDRVFPVTIFPCDMCARDYFNAGNGSCVCKCSFISVITGSSPKLKYSTVDSQTWFKYM